MTMAQEVTNFARFFAAFNKLPYNGSREEFKKQIVLQYTWNRTDSLREMTRREYNDCCDALEKLNGQKDEQKKRRSECLKLMQKLGIDTTDWPRINAFCLSIASCCAYAQSANSPKNSAASSRSMSRVASRTCCLSTFSACSCFLSISVSMLGCLRPCG